MSSMMPAGKTENNVWFLFSFDGKLLFGKQKCPVIKAKQRNTFSVPFLMLRMKIGVKVYMHVGVR